MPKKAHKAFCLLTEDELAILEAEAKAAGMNMAELLKSRLLPQSASLVMNAISMTWEHPGVSLTCRNLDWPTWKKLLGVVQLAEPLK